MPSVPGDPGSTHKSNERTSPQATAGTRSASLVALALVSGLEGLALLGYALFDVIQGMTVGITGPAGVSSVTALTLQIVIFFAFGLGLLVVGRGWWQARRWARAPFVLAQLIALVVGVPLAQAAETSSRIPGIVISLVAALGLVLVFLPRTTRALAER